MILSQANFLSVAFRDRFYVLQQWDEKVLANGLGSAVALVFYKRFYFSNAPKLGGKTRRVNTSRQSTGAAAILRFYCADLLAMYNAAIESYNTVQSTYTVSYALVRFY